MDTPPTRSRSYGTIPTYELHTLGWKAFQDLCVAVSAEVLARPVQTFLPSRDGGRDGAFVGTWQGAPSAPSAKSTIQCKFTSKANATLSLTHIRPELARVRSLAERELAHDYILMTNAAVSGAAEADIAAAFEQAGAQRARVFGGEWLTTQIQERPRLRMMVPRLYGLGDLSQIIDERAYEQAKQILSAMGDDLRCFVITAAYRKSVEALTRHGFVLLLGDPASGKSTIGASLAVGALDNGSIGTIRVTSPDEMARHWNPNEPSQFFWVDDAFGPTQYQRELVDGWNRQLPLLRGAIKAGANVLFTSRNYIWESAKRDLKISQFPLLRQSQVIIDVQRLSEAERAQILYNHIKMGDQPRPVRRRLKPFLSNVCSNAAFLPETARRLGSTFFTKSLTLDLEHIIEFVEHPVEFLKDVLRNMNDAGKAAIALIFLNGSPGVPSPLLPSEAMNTVSRLLGVTHAATAKALETLNGSLTLLVQTPGGARWRYKHPTISDAFASLVAESPELIEIYVDGAKIDRLLNEVVCGNIPIRGAQVRVPSSLYGRLIVRLLELPEARVESFLTYRCDAELVSSYLKERPHVLEQTGRIMSELSISSSAKFFAKLRAFDLLPESVREEVADTICDLTIEMVDASVFHDDDIRSLLTNEEFNSLSERFERDVIGRLDQVIRSWEHDWSVSDESSHMYGLAEQLGHFASFKKNTDDGVSSRLLLGIKKVEDRAAELADEETPRIRPQAPSPSPVLGGGISEIFDDVDE